MLKDKVVLVSGGAGLIGKEFIKAIAKNGATAIIADIDENIGLQTKQNLQKEPGSASIDFIKLDITSADSLEACIEHISKKYGKIDALVNSAYPRNKNYGRHFFDVKFDDFVENLGLNLGGYFLSSKHFAKFFQTQKYGNIINISSIYGVIAPKFEVYDDTPMTMPVEYAAIKSGLIHLTKYMAKYFKGQNIRVNAISPGGIFDHQNEIFLKNYKAQCLNKGMLDPCDLTGALIFLLSDASLYVNGQNIIVDDGFCL